MKRLKKIYLFPVILLIIFLIIIGIYYFLLRKTTAAIVVETVPISEVLIDGEKQGKTPFEGEFESGDRVIKLVPETFDTPLVPYESKVKLVSGVTTIVRREFGEEEQGASGEIISYEKLSSNEISISVITKPDGAKVYIDNEFVDLAPAKSSNLSPGEHEVTVLADGFIERKFKVVAESGYRVTVIVDLAVDTSYEAETKVESVSDEMEIEEEDEVVMIEISNTSVGFLRVREGPSVNNLEIGRVEPGDQFELIETDDDSGWYKIEFEEGEEGWVSDEYAEIVSKENDVSEDDSEEVSEN